MDLGRARVPQGEVHVIVERCKECNFCIKYCPAQVLEYSTQTNDKGYHYPVMVADKADGCVYCKFCDLICPELAIYTTPVDGDADAG
ncbi:MAG: 4Fe-4S dicluster domain-containing protein [Gammaproteobacteria bacterium]|nr:4Fe-4S dicluster domain-containing protein [Gammaproteobacteria bacterium]NNF62401.1 4Fe-4S dicluster domain-containing protein [Gammaproteobacteria bacterium]NNM20909.1 4Fe-4S dicluster domain-containing protein [Gammaproteobacteria bacterium]